MSKNDAPGNTAVDPQNKLITGEVLPAENILVDEHPQMDDSTDTPKEHSCCTCVAPSPAGATLMRHQDELRIICEDVEACRSQLDGALRALLYTDCDAHPAIWVEVADLLATTQILWKDYNRRWGQYISCLNKCQVDDWKAKIQADILAAVESRDSARVQELLGELAAARFKPALPSMDRSIHEKISLMIEHAKVVAEYDRDNLAEDDLALQSVLDFNLSRGE